MKCSSADHQYFYGLFLPSIFFTIIYTFGFPFAILVILLKNRKNLHAKKFEIKFGFLYDNYKSHLWWMEIAYICRRLLIISIISFLDTQNQELVVTLILFAYFIFFVLFPPYHDKSEANAEILVTTTLILLISAGSFYQYANLAWVNIVGIFVYLLCFVCLFFSLITKFQIPCAHHFRKKFHGTDEHQ